MEFRSSFRKQKNTSESFDCRSEGKVEELYQAVAPYALSKTLYMVGCPQIAQEILQEVFLKLWSKKLVFLSIKSAYQWIYTACHYRAIDYLKASVNRVKKEALAELCLPETVSDRTANGQMIGMIAAQLSKRQLSILSYRFVDGHRVADIADMMKLSEKTIQRELKLIKKLGMKMKGVWDD